MEDLIKIEEVSDIKKKILIIVSPDNVNKKFDDFFKNIKKDVHINGFRKGKVPVNVLKKYFDDRAKDTVSQILLEEYYSKAIRDNNINVVGSPILDNESTGVFSKDNSYSVNFLVEILPNLNLENYDKINLNIETTNLTIDIEAKILSYREQFAERKQVSDRSAQLGDAVVIDFTGFINNIPFEGGHSDGHSINKLGNENLIIGFEDQIVGMKIEESKRIKIKFPDDYGAKEIAGKEAEFEIKLHTIIESKLADVNDDLALMVGFKTVDELKTKIKADVEGEIENRNRVSLERQIVEKIKETNTIKMPESLLKDEQVAILKKAGVKDKINDVMLNSVKGIAQFNIERKLIFDAIYEKEITLEIAPDELDKTLDENAVKSNMSKDDFISMLYNSKQMDSFMDILKAKKVVDFIINCSKNNKDKV